MSLNPGDFLRERYRIIGIIGKGGMGAVYAAEHPVIGSRVGGSDVLQGAEEFAFALPPTRGQRYLVRLALAMLPFVAKRHCCVKNSAACGRPDSGPEGSTSRTAPPAASPTSARAQGRIRNRSMHGLIDR